MIPSSISRSAAVAIVPASADGSMAAGLAEIIAVANAIPSNARTRRGIMIRLNGGANAKIGTILMLRSNADASQIERGLAKVWNRADEVNRKLRKPMQHP